MLELRSDREKPQKDKKSNPGIMRLIALKIEALRENPLPNGAIKLKSYEELYRVNIKEYLIVYEFDNKTLIVIIDLRVFIPC